MNHYLKRIVKKLFYKKGVGPTLFEKVCFYTAAIMLCTVVVANKKDVNANASVGLSNIKTIDLESGPGVELAETPYNEPEFIVASNELADNGTLKLVTDNVVSDVVVAIDSTPEIVEEAIKEEEQYETVSNPTTYMGKFTLTAYCSCKTCCGRWSPEVTGKASFTESGTNPKQGRTVAVDKGVIPLGTHLLINGHEYVAEDTGSAVDGKHIDIYFSSHSQAKAFGMQKGEVYIIN